MFQPQERNPVTREAHRRQVLWQISLPFGVGILLILALAGLTVLSALGGGAGVSRWADISLIWLILPMIVFTLILLAIVAGLVYLIVKLISVLPGSAFKVQELMASWQEKIRSASDKAAQPVIRVGGFWAGVRKLFGK